MITMRTAAVLLVAAALAGCSAGAYLRATDDDPTPSSTPSATAPASPAPATDLADGRHWAKVTAFDDEGHTLTVDVVQFFTGDAAVKAAVEDGWRAEDVANDHYTRNTNDRLRTLPYDPGLQVLVNTLAFDKTGSSAEDTRITQAEMAAYAEAGETAKRLFWFDVQAGVVVALHEQYLP